MFKPLTVTIFRGKRTKITFYPIFSEILNPNKVFTWNWLRKKWRPLLRLTEDAHSYLVIG